MNHLMLGQLIYGLSQIDGHLPLTIDYAEQGLGDVDSYRGYYDQLALEPSNRPESVSAGLSLLRHAVGRTFVGYKGGDFVMQRETKVWVSHYGEASGRFVSGVMVDVLNDRAVIVTDDEKW